MKLPIYFDYASTTPADPRVVKKMQECLSLDGNFGNPASRSHAFGWKAEEAAEEMNRTLAQFEEYAGANRLAAEPAKRKLCTVSLPTSAKRLMTICARWEATN